MPRERSIPTTLAPVRATSSAAAPGARPDIEDPLPVSDLERVDEVARGLREPRRVHPFVGLRDVVVGAPVVHGAQPTRAPGERGTTARLRAMRRGRA